MTTLYNVTIKNIAENKFYGENKSNKTWREQMRTLIKGKQTFTYN